MNIGDKVRISVLDSGVPYGSTGVLRDFDGVNNEIACVHFDNPRGYSGHPDYVPSSWWMMTSDLEIITEQEDSENNDDDFNLAIQHEPVINHADYFARPHPFRPTYGQEEAQAEAESPMETGEAGPDF
jgi:hypothetical protein